MRDKDNGDPLVCVQNLFSIVRAEVPFSRMKGVDSRLFDRPMTSMEELDESVTELIAEYEPRVSPDSISIKISPESGEAEILVNAALAEEEPDEYEEE